MWLPAGTAYAVPVSRDSLAAVGGTLGSGIVLPLGDGTCPLGEVSRIAGYLAGESAGQCGPCKLGLPAIARALAAIVDGSGGIEALDVARRSAAAVAGRGACSHPDGMTRFVLSALDVFTEDLAAQSSARPAAARSAACCRCQPARSRKNSSGSWWTGRVVRAMGCVLNWCPR